MELRYRGVRTLDENRVTVRDENNKSSLLDPRYDLVSHSPDGFEWGYNGSGPAQLACAILARELGGEAALKHYQEFKRRVVSCFVEHTWDLTSADIRTVIAEIEKESK